MSVRLNTCPNGYMVPPGGYPYELSYQVDTVLEGFIPAGVSSVCAVVACVNGSCDVHAAIYEPPTTSNGSPGALVTDANDSSIEFQADIESLTGVGQVLTLTLPVVTVPTRYVYRLWYDAISSSPKSFSGFTGKWADTNALLTYPVTVLVGSITLDFTTGVYLTSASTIGSLSSGSLGDGE